MKKPILSTGQLRSALCFVILSAGCFAAQPIWAYVEGGGDDGGSSDLPTSVPVLSTTGSDTNWGNAVNTWGQQQNDDDARRNAIFNRNMHDAIEWLDDLFGGDGGEGGDGPDDGTGTTGEGGGTTEGGTNDGGGDDGTGNGTCDGGGEGGGGTATPSGGGEDSGGEGTCENESRSSSTQNGTTTFHTNRLPRGWENTLSAALENASKSGALYGNSVHFKMSDYVKNSDGGFSARITFIGKNGETSDAILSASGSGLKIVRDASAPNIPANIGKGLHFKK